MDGLVRLVRERTLAILLLLLVGGFIMVGSSVALRPLAGW